MKLSITPSEYTFLHTLGSVASQKRAEYESAIRDFRIAFDASMRARAIEQATFVAMSPDMMEVEVPADAPRHLSLVKDDDPPPEAA